MLCGTLVAAAGAKEATPTMTIDLDVAAPLLALLAGILILIFPRILNYIVAIYLIIIGLIGLLPFFT
jgi:hypothetical protein